MANVKLNDNDGMSKFYEGIDIAYRFVGSTYGPNGKTVLINKFNKKPFFTKDGVTVARNLKVTNDNEINAGVEFIKSSAEKLNEKVGDGTTTAIIMSHAILKFVNENKSSIAKIHQMENVFNSISKYFDKNKKSLKDKDLNEYVNIAKTACNGDLNIANIVGEIFHSSNSFELIEINRSNIGKHSFNRVSGFSLESGYMTEAFLTNTQKKQIKLYKPVILTVDEEVHELDRIIPVIEMCHKKQRPLLIMANNFSESVLDIIYSNASQGINIHTILNGNFSDYRSKILSDLDSFLYDDRIDEYNAMCDDKFMINDAEEVIICKDETLFIPIEGRNKSYLEAKKEEIIDFVVNSEGLEKAMYMQRLSSLNANKVYLNIYADNDYTYKELLDRVEDAICATRNAKEYGYINGGHVTYLRALLYFMKGNEIDTEIFDCAMEPLSKLYNIEKYDMKYIKDMIKDIDSIDDDELISRLSNNLYTNSPIEPVSIMIESIKIALDLGQLFLSTKYTITEDMYNE